MHLRAGQGRWILWFLGFEAHRAVVEKERKRGSVDLRWFSLMESHRGAVFCGFFWVFLILSPLLWQPMIPQPISFPGCHWELSLWSWGSSKLGVSCLCQAGKRGKRDTHCSCIVFPKRSNFKMVKICHRHDSKSILSVEVWYLVCIFMPFLFGIVVVLSQFHPSMNFWRSCPCRKTWSE